MDMEIWRRRSTLNNGPQTPKKINRPNSNATTTTTNNNNNKNNSANITGYTGFCKTNSVCSILNGGHIHHPVATDGCSAGRSKSRIVSITRFDSSPQSPQPLRRVLGISSGTHIRRLPPSVPSRTMSPALSRLGVASLRKEIVEQRADPSPAPSRPPRTLARHSIAASPPTLSLNNNSEHRGRSGHQLQHHRMSSAFNNHGGERGGRLSTLHPQAKSSSIVNNDNNNNSNSVKKNVVVVESGGVVQNSPVLGSLGVARRNIVLDAKQGTRPVTEQKKLLEELSVSNATVPEEAVRHYKELCNVFGQEPQDAWITAVLGDTKKPLLTSSVPTTCSVEYASRFKSPGKERERTTAAAAAAALHNGVYNPIQRRRVASTSRITRRVQSTDAGKKMSTCSPKLFDPGAVGAAVAPSTLQRHGKLSTTTGSSKDNSASDTVLNRMMDYCQHLKPYQQKMDVLKKKRQDVQDAVDRFVSLCQNLNSETSKSTSRLSTMTALESQASVLTDGLKGIQQCNVGLLLRLAEYSREVRRPLGSVGRYLEDNAEVEEKDEDQDHEEEAEEKEEDPQKGVPDEKEKQTSSATTAGVKKKKKSSISKNKFFSPKSLHKRKLTNPSAQQQQHQQGSSEGASAANSVIFPSIEEPPQAFLNFLRKEEGSIVQQLLDVCSRVREALTSEMNVAIADEAMLGTPLFLASTARPQQLTCSEKEMQQSERSLVQMHHPTSPVESGTSSMAISTTDIITGVQPHVVHKHSGGSVKSTGKVSKNGMVTDESGRSTPSDQQTTTTTTVNTARGDAAVIDRVPFVGVSVMGWMPAEENENKNESSNDCNSPPSFSPAGNPRLVLGGGKRSFLTNMTNTLPIQANGKTTTTTTVKRSKSASISTLARGAKKRKSTPSSWKTAATPLPSAQRSVTSGTSKKKKEGRLSVKSSDSSNVMTDAIFEVHIKEAESTWEAIKGLADIIATRTPKEKIESVKQLYAEDTKDNDSITQKLTGQRVQFNAVTPSRPTSASESMGGTANKVGFSRLNKSSDSTNSNDNLEVFEEKTPLSITLAADAATGVIIADDGDFLRNDKKKTAETEGIYHFPPNSIQNEEQPNKETDIPQGTAIMEKKSSCSNTDFNDKTNNNNNNNNNNNEKYYDSLQPRSLNQSFSLSESTPQVYVTMSIRIQSCWRRYISRQKMKRRQRELEEEKQQQQLWQYKHVMTARLQRLFRGIISRRRLRERIILQKQKEQQQQKQQTDPSHNLQDDNNMKSVIHGGSDSNKKNDYYYCKENTERRLTIREKFEQAKERRRALLRSNLSDINAVTDGGSGTPCNASDLEGTTKSKITDHYQEEKKKGAHAGGQEMNEKKNINIPHISLREHGISTFDIENYNPDSEHFNVYILHRLLHVCKPLLYTIRVLCDVSPTEPVSALAFLKRLDSEKFGVEHGDIEMVQTDHEEEKKKEKERDENTHHNTSNLSGEEHQDRKKSNQHVGSGTHFHRGGKKEKEKKCKAKDREREKEKEKEEKEEAEVKWELQPYRLICRRLFARKTAKVHGANSKHDPSTSASLPPASPLSVRVLSFVDEHELRRKEPIGKHFQRPFERWGTALAFQRRIFSLAAEYAWKLIFSHTPHDDYKQRMLRTKEEKEARLLRVEQRNRMILACYCVRSEREWLKEASKDLSFVAHIWNPKKSLDPKDPDFERHCRETYEFVEDFLYQCFPTISSLDDIPPFLTGAGIFFLMKSTLGYTKEMEEDFSKVEKNNAVLNARVDTRSEAKPLPVATAVKNNSRTVCNSTLQQQQQQLSLQDHHAMFTYEMLNALDDLVLWCASSESRKAYTVSTCSNNGDADNDGRSQNINNNDNNTNDHNSNVIDGEMESFDTLEDICERTIRSLGTTARLGESATFSFVSLISEDGGGDAPGRAREVERPQLHRVAVPPSKTSTPPKPTCLSDESYQLKDGKKRNNKNNKNNRNNEKLEIVYPKGYLVCLSERLLRAFFELKVELDVCEDLDATV